ncbi:tetratricopeptide repeat protein [Granulosicoccus antarcticus]|uniref:Cytochrome c-type biogenesis protein H Ig-like domain-containing protein n=1 Tax=Granulosicoccus antarcticus IMCC3135 TaxID=1192854 RepID=A0A2Z2NRX4_9GAMM|nr:hypothetical protein [Granulosicoccus antarcticus]ASJ74276.1 hypothetical protein IMCC3135_20995 [Granulosicoccus antarcticus IMCC3135]
MSVRIFLSGLSVLSLLMVVYHEGQSADSISESSISADIDSEFDSYASREQIKLKKELEKYLKAKPGEFEVQLSQAKVLFDQQQYEEADALIQSTREQFPDQPDLLAYHAEIIASMNNGSFAGKAFDLLGRSLDIDNKHKPSLWMMALVNQQSGNDEAAVILFELLKREIPPDSNSIELIDAAIAFSVTRVDTRSESDAANDMVADVDSTRDNTSVNPELSLYITLDPEISSTFSPDDVVYVYAQAAGESAMPLAVTRRQISDFPTTVKLDDSMAMMPDQSLSSSAMVTVGARASRSGTAMPLAGDWEVKLYEVPVDTSEVIPLNIQYELK